MSRDEEIPPAPPGFVASTGRGPFTTHNGPLFHRESAEGAHQAFFALARHCNGVGLLHGGMLSAFLDGLLSSAVGRASGVASVTVHLSVDFLDMGRANDWVLGDASVTRVTRDMAFAEGDARMAGRTLARASGVFRLMRRHTA